MKQMTVRPLVPGVRYPDGRLLPQEGTEVPADSYWKRRLMFKEVELVPEKPVEKEVKKYTEKGVKNNGNIIQ